MWSNQAFLTIAVCVGHASAFQYGAALNRVSAGSSPGISSRGCTLVATPGMKLRSGGGAFTDFSLEVRIPPNLPDSSAPAALLTPVLPRELSEPCWA